jgi:hypothetical protein
MTQAARFDFRRSRCSWAALCACALAAGGCAGRAWLESPSEAELLLDPPAHSYPTAVRGSLSDNSAPVAAAAATLQTAPTSASTAPSASASVQSPAAVAQHAPIPPSQRPERQQALLTPLAVVPSQFIHPPASSAPNATVPVVTSPPASADMPPGAIKIPWASPPFLPGLDASVTASAASQQFSHPGPAVVPLASPAVSMTSSAASGDSQPAREKHESPLERQARLDRAQSELIDALEAEIRQRRAESPGDEALSHLEQQLRLAYVVSGRLDDAVAAVESLDSQQREAYKHLMFGLGVWLSPDESHRPPLRGAKVLHSLRDATADLAAASKLELRNLVFCERVDHFGWYGEFPRKEFQPKQQVILYAEVENFTAEQKGPGSYETELQGSYEILDASGQIVASRQLQLDKEVCRNYRRDYFLAYRIYMPDNISPGHYRLELTVEDLKARGKYQGRKLGEGMIEFTIR